MLPLATLPILLWAQTPQPFAQEVAAAERAFARQAREQGTRTAFLAWLAPQSRVLKPEPDPGLPQYEARKEDGALLAWGPAHVEASRSGDLALSTGPWTWHPKPEAAAVAQGWFLSVWQRQPDGRLKVLVDAGTPQRPPAAGESPLTVTPPPPVAAAPLTAATLLAEEGRLQALEARDGVVASLKACAAGDLRLYRPGAAPRLGREAGLEAVREEASGTGWSLVASGASQAGDLGYTVGTDRTAGGSGRSFFRIWRAEGGAWKVIADLRLPLPKAQP